jgi:hypothetical protein
MIFVVAKPLLDSTSTLAVMFLWLPPFRLLCVDMVRAYRGNVWRITRDVRRSDETRYRAEG